MCWWLMPGLYIYIYGYDRGCGFIYFDMIYNIISIMVPRLCYRRVRACNIETGGRGRCEGD
ncbi:hypothetical protein BDV40DRAFT_260083 [Aspergillus tamarii]|uniref:Uncharacterized protein n=1 Tax=Aspergillus tamarii TaxID=41984 RepID=A0A5N6V191_ASPTM|nr:hypothetical protein BDV40DRAFT_260083 [Aspergillus tamarii]